MPAESVNTRRAARRSLRFESIEELLAEVERLAAADRAGTLTRGGNWTLGKTLGHLAAWVEYGYAGYPMRPPLFFIRWVLRGQLRGILDRGMPAGIRIPGVAAGTYGQDEMPTDAAVERLRRALERLDSGESCAHDSPAFGRMSHADRVRLNLRHAELHLSFFDGG